jgi:3',5'-cyclic AMP phosphodiesterase CpdA
MPKGRSFHTGSSAVSIVLFKTISNEVCTMSNQGWSRAMRAIWLLNTIEVEFSHLGIPLMRVPPTLRDLGDILAQGTMSDVDRQLIADELSRAHASLAQVVGELQAGITEIEALLHEQPVSLTTENVAEITRSVVWQKS